VEDSKKIFTQILKELNEKELKEFITKYCKTNVQMQNKFLSHFSHKIQGKPEEKYQLIIDNCIKACTNSRGHFLIDPRKTNNGLKPLFKLLKEEKNSYHSKPYEPFVFVKLILENFGELIDEFYEVHDFDKIDNLFYETLEILKGICESKNTPNEFKDEIFEYLLEASQNPNFERGNTYHDTQIDFDLLKMAAIVSTGENIGTLLKIIDKKINSYSRYASESFLGLKVSILKKYQLQEELSKTIHDNMDNESIRNAQIDAALQNGDLNKVFELIKEGIALFEKKRLNGVVKRYNDKLLEIYKLHKMEKEYKELLQALYDEDFSKEYYVLLKELYSKNEWRQECQNIIKRIKIREKKSGYGFVHKLAEIYVDEEMEEELFELIQKNQSLIFLNNYGVYCKKSYSGELLKMYHTHIMQELSFSSTRKRYSELAYLLKNISNIYIGGREFVGKMYKSIKTIHVKKPAMMEEMSILDSLLADDANSEIQKVKTEQKHFFE